MKLRYAKDSDFDFLIEGLEKNRTFENRPKEQIRARPSDKRQLKQATKNKNIRVAEDNGEPLAFLYFRPGFKVMYITGKTFWVDLIYVKEGCRRKGLGKLLYEDAIRIARKRGFKKIVIDIFEANRDSVKFHKALGFEPVYTIFQKEV